MVPAAAVVLKLNPRPKSPFPNLRLSISGIKSAAQPLLVTGLLPQGTGLLELLVVPLLPAKSVPVLVKGLLNGQRPR